MRLTYLTSDLKKNHEFLFKKDTIKELSAKYELSKICQVNYNSMVGAFNENTYYGKQVEFLIHDIVVSNDKK